MMAKSSISKTSKQVIGLLLINVALYSLAVAYASSYSSGLGI